MGCRRGYGRQPSAPDWTKGTFAANHRRNTRRLQNFKKKLNFFIFLGGGGVAFESRSTPARPSSPRLPFGPSAAPAIWRWNESWICSQTSRAGRPAARRSLRRRRRRRTSGRRGCDGTNASRHPELLSLTHTHTASPKAVLLSPARFSHIASRRSPNCRHPFKCNASLESVITQRRFVTTPTFEQHDRSQASSSHPHPSPQTFSCDGSVA